MGTSPLANRGGLLAASCTSASAMTRPFRTHASKVETIQTRPHCGLKFAPLREDLEHACDAVRLAAKLCDRVQRQLSDTEKADKIDESPVTVADYGAQAVVAWALSRHHPDDRLSMVAEEDSVSLRETSGRPMLERITELVNSIIHTVDCTATLSPEEVIDLIDLGASPGGPTGRHWVLDPIDGTRGFVSMRQYAVCLGLLQDGEVVLGVLGCPNLPRGEVASDAGAPGLPPLGGSSHGCLFLAHKGYGSYMTSLWHAEEGLVPIRVQVQQPTMPAYLAMWGRVPTCLCDQHDFSGIRYMESYESRHSSHDTTAQLAQLLGIKREGLRMDSQVKYGLLSRGDASIFMRFPPESYREKIWDHLPGFVIVEEAGGKVTDGTGRRLDFSKGRYLELRKGLISAPPNVHTALVEAISTVIVS